jgi:hypothetical protein
LTAEETRLADAQKRVAHWRRWGPYLSERAWGTVREDYSADGDAWRYFPFDHARSRAFRWNEDGLAGVSDRHQRICFAIALWNGRDPMLKERLFGVSGKEGNHGEDVKECYFHLDNTPTHAYMKYLYKYPHAAFPYAALVEESLRRTRLDPEYELLDTGIFDAHRYFDVFVEYAKASPEDVLVRITAVNRASEAATLHLLPTIWFRNRWSWRPGVRKPRLCASGAHANVIALDEPRYGQRWLICEGAGTAAGADEHAGGGALLFTENETNACRLFGADAPSTPCYAKDGINDRVVSGVREAVNPAREGTKASAWFTREIAGGESVTWRLRLTNVPPRTAAPSAGTPGASTPGTDAAIASLGDDFDDVFERRIREANEFYAHIIPAKLTPDAALVMRQSLSGLLWSKQYYHFVVKEWLEGDPLQPPPPPERLAGRNREWTHVYNADVVSMPDKWEYPWYAAWDLAFHCVPLALVDPDFAKTQLLLFLREWYMHPNGQLPAYEWKFSDVNPPVHAWAAWRVYKIDKKRHGVGDTAFLERVFHKLLLNFTWWVNRKDPDGRNLFQGGFLGLDNIGVFDRSAPLPEGGHLEQSDCTSWMGMYTLNLLAMALELARHDPVYEDVASKFWEHFLYIANAINKRGDDVADLWNDEDGFYYDVLRMPGGASVPLKVRSMVGLIPLFAVETLDSGLLARLPAFARRLEWFIEHRPDLTAHVASMRPCGVGERRLFAIVWEDRLRRLLKVMLDEREFLSPFGIRALSRIHRDQPYHLAFDGVDHIVDYEPGEATTGLFGGNSNWRGPIWFPVNYLLIEALQRFHYYFGDGFTVECPTGSGQMMTLSQVAEELSHRLTRLFLRDADGRRPAFGDRELLQRDPHWRDYLLFHEYFHGDTGVGLGASHQTGWTALVAKLLQQSGD